MTELKLSTSIMQWQWVKNINWRCEIITLVQTSLCIKSCSYRLRALVDVHIEHQTRKMRSQWLWLWFNWFWVCRVFTEWWVTVGLESAPLPTVSATLAVKQAEEIPACIQNPGQLHIMHRRDRVPGLTVAGSRTPDGGVEHMLDARLTILLLCTLFCRIEEAFNLGQLPRNCPRLANATLKSLQAPFSTSHL